MRNLLIDTNIYTYALKGDDEVVSVLQRANKIGISVISMGELLSGFKAGNREEKNINEMEAFLDSERVVIYPVDDETAEFYAEILNSLKKKGKPVSTNDIWIAATAFQHGLKLFTKDQHFRHIAGLIEVC